MKIFLTIAFLFSAFPALGNNDICSRSQVEMRDYLRSQSSRIGFKNSGGLINGGVCWWHSRFQRSSAYLVRFDERGRRPDRVEARKIALELRNMNKVVTIPGYSNFRDFSRDHKRTIQSVLEGWQRIDGFLNFEWIRGISGSSKLPSDSMKVRMDKVFNSYNNSPTPLWIMAQIKGITSHSLMILEMFKKNDGYELLVIDSNNPTDTLSVIYREGDTSLRVAGEPYTFVPYVGFQNDFKKIASALKKHCGENLIEEEEFDVAPGDIEL